MHNERECRLLERGYDLGKVAPPKAKYLLLKRAGNLIFSSGALPMVGDALCAEGKVLDGVSVENAAKAAALCAANVLRAVAKEFGSLDQIKQVVKVNGFVNSSPAFCDQHLVINGASNLLLHVFGEAGTHARSAVGVAGLPLNAPVEIDIVFELRD